MMKRLSGLVLLLCLANFLSAQDMHMDTYCNPLNIDYTYMIYNSDKNISYRSGADPAVVEFRGEYYMFVTRSHGYWRFQGFAELGVCTSGQELVSARV